MNINYVFKTIIIGDNGVGKSSILNAYINDKFSTHYSGTIGVDFEIKIEEIEDKIVKLHIWDTAGSEKFRSIIRSYYKNCMGYVLVFDLSNEKSFNNIEGWINDVTQNCYNSDIITFILVGNKSDLLKRQVSHSQAKELADKYGIEYIETSAKKNNNIKKVYRTLIKYIYDKVKSGEIELEDNIINIKNNFSIDEGRQYRSFFKCC